MKDPVNRISTNDRRKNLRLAFVLFFTATGMCSSTWSLHVFYFICEKMNWLNLFSMLVEFLRCLISKPWYGECALSFSLFQGKNKLSCDFEKICLKSMVIFYSLFNGILGVEPWIEGYHQKSHMVWVGENYPWWYIPT